MSIFNLMKAKGTIGSKEAAEIPAPGFIDVVEASAANQYDVENANSRDRLIMEGRRERNKLFQENTGLTLRDQITDNTLHLNNMKWDPVSKNMRSDSPNVMLGRQFDREDFDKFEGLKSTHIQQLREANPDNPKYKDIKTDDEILKEAIATARQSSDRYEEVSSRASTFDSLVGSLVGGMGASLSDPANLAAMIPTAGLGYKAVTASATVVKPLLNRMGLEFLENGLQEVGMFDEIKTWKQEIGKDYSYWNLATNVFTSGTLGAGVVGGSAAIGKGLSKISAKFKDKNLRVELEKASADLPKVEKKAAKAIERQLHYDEAKPKNSTNEVHSEAIEQTAKALEENRAVNPSDIKVKDSDVALTTDLLGDVKDQTIMSTDPSYRAKEFDIPDIKERIAAGEAWRVTLENDKGEVSVVDFFESKENIQEMLRGELVTSFEPVTDIPFMRDGVVEFKRPKENARLSVNTEIEIKRMQAELETDNQWTKELSTQDPKLINEAIESKKGKLYKEIETIAGNKVINDLGSTPDDIAMLKGDDAQTFLPVKEIEEIEIAPTKPKLTDDGATTGKVVWFDEIEGKGKIVDSEGNTHFVNYKSIEGIEDQLKGNEIAGEVIWWSKRDGNGIVQDAKGNEIYVDSSVIGDLEQLVPNSRVALEINPSVKDIKAGRKVRVLESLKKGDSIEFTTRQGKHAESVDMVRKAKEVDKRQAPELAVKSIAEKEVDLKTLNKEIEAGNVHRLSIEGEDGKIFVVDKIIKGESVEEFARRSGDVVIDSKQLTAKVIEENGARKFAKEDPLKNKQTREMIDQEFDQMISEVEEAISISENTFDQGTGAFISRKNISTFPEWYQSLNLKNKEELATIIKRGKGKRFNRIADIAIDRLEKGYSSKVAGDVVPSDSYRLAAGKEPLGIVELPVEGKSRLELSRTPTKREVTITKVQDDFNEALGITEFETPTAEEARLTIENYHSTEAIEAEQRSFNDIVKEDPDVEMGDGRTLREVVEDMKEDEKGLEALTSCSLKGQP